MELKQTVYHQKHGKGRVERLYNNASIALVDFGGTMKRCEVALLGTTKDTFTKAEVVAKIDGLLKEFGDNQNAYAQGGWIALNRLKNEL